MAGARAFVVVLLGLLLAASAAGDPGTDKARVDDRLADLRAAVDASEAKEGVLTEELSAVAGLVRELTAGVASQQARLGVLEAELGSARQRLAELEETIRVQTGRLERLKREQAVALERLEQRVRAIYVSDDPDLISFLLGTTSFSDLLDKLELVSRISGQDERILTRVETARDGVADARRKTRAARTEAAATERAVATQTAEQQGVVTRLVASRNQLVSAESAKRAALSSIQGDQDHALEEIVALEEQSAALAERIRAAQEAAAAAAAAASSAPAIVAPVGGSGLLAWPVSGPVTSGFGPRWGRLHEGIDISVSEGTPVRAAAAGTVIYSGWLGGYGNLVVIDHGNGLSTAYAHNSSFASTVGQSVVAGETIAYSGNTGDSSGPHVHFEVRVGGSAVDPLGYL
ncbi:MAG: murein hydrolase activator EnvC family protein [Gaiella sp.]